MNHKDSSFLPATAFDKLAEKTALIIRDAFDAYSIDFLGVTRRSKVNFEKRNWKEQRKNAYKRLDLYEESLTYVSEKIQRLLEERQTYQRLWIMIKDKYSELIKERYDVDLAETYFNSVTRKILMTIGLNRDVEYFYLNVKPYHKLAHRQVYRSYRKTAETKDLIRKLLEDFHLEAGFENIERDAERVANEIDLYLWPIAGFENNLSIEVIRHPFFRNKVAYIVGRIDVRKRLVPFILPLYNITSGIYVDTVLLDEADINIVFSFAHSYFHIEVDRHDMLIAFLKSILPGKPVSELYNSIGYNRHGKTEFYRDLHRFVHVSREKFVIAPGKEGAVMIVFTLPHYNYVFKVIKDKPCFLRSDHTTSKEIIKEQVIFQYSYVCHQDRVGRLVDTQEFENLRFKTKRFSNELISEFLLAAKNNVIVKKDYIIINHLYLQRKVIPLPLYLQGETDPEKIRQVIIDYGYFIRDLASIGIFPSDFFNTWNYGITELGKVVLFDYDDVMPLEKVNFLTKPVPRNDFEEMAPEEDWIVAAPEDFFIDEMDRYSGIPLPLKGVFKSIHRDLYTVEYWREMKKTVLGGEIIDIIPYNRNKSFRK